ncbi:hypothetical protein [Hyphomicrobium sulfonivorans]|nr:hypothetical protein [Hyphomicrobium sulfonivorans]
MKSKTTMTGFEKRRQRLLSRPAFAKRMLRAALFWLIVTMSCLVVGIAGYAIFEGMSLTDAFLNASMILSGMGSVSELKTTQGKLFAGFYAIFSGLIIIVAYGFVLAPIAHRVLHRFHIETQDED